MASIIIISLPEDIELIAVTEIKEHSAVEFRAEEHRNLTFLCPPTNYPKCVWLKSPVEKALLSRNGNLFGGLISDRRTMMIVFSNTEEHLARERYPCDPRATLSMLQSTQMKTNRLTEVLGDDTMEVVITIVGGGKVSKALLSFVKAVEQ
jgi:hypothetical protein